MSLRVFIGPLFRDGKEIVLGQRRAGNGVLLNQFGTKDYFGPRRLSKRKRLDGGYRRRKMDRRENSILGGPGKPEEGLLGRGIMGGVEEALTQRKGRNLGKLGVF